MATTPVDKAYDAVNDLHLDSGQLDDLISQLMDLHTETERKEILTARNEPSPEDAVIRENVRATIPSPYDLQELLFGHCRPRH